MIGYNNNTITGMYYSGYTIVRAYGCGGELVYGEEPTPPTPSDGKLKYVISGQTYTIPCDNSPVLTRIEVIRDLYNRGLAGKYSAMTSVEVGSCVTELEHSLFDEVWALTSATIPNSVTTMGYEIFGECSGLTSLNFPSGITEIGMHMCEACYSLSALTLPNALTSIEKNAFTDNLSLWDIVIPSGVTSIADDAFRAEMWGTEPHRTMVQQMNNNRTVTILAPVPPTLGDGVFGIIDDTTDFATYPIYVPAESVNAYKTASVWSIYASRIFPIE